MGGLTEPWYVAAFRDEYLTVYPHRDLESARDEIAWAHSVGLDGRVLDLCCGFGRHTLALRELGVEVVGMDLSPELLRASANLGAAPPITERLIRGDVRALPFEDASFDGLVNLFSSFGYFGDEGDRGVLAEVVRVVRSGGLCLFDLMLPSTIKAGLVPESKRDTAAGLLIEQRSLEDGGSRVVKRVRLEAPSGEVREWREDVRLYGPGELDELFESAGLELLGRYGGLGGELFGEGASRQVLLAKRR